MVKKGKTVDEMSYMIQNDVNKTYTRTEAIEIYRTNMNKNSFKEKINQ